MHTIDVGNFQLRSDLILDNIPKNHPGIEEEKEEDITVYRMTIDDNNTIQGKEKGKYITISFPDITDKNNFKKVEKVLIQELKKILEPYHIKEQDSILVIGLGNSKSTPDSLGPKAIEQVLVTRYLFELGEVEKGYKNVASFKPEVTGTTGIETKEMVETLVKTVHASFVIVIDALASSSLERVNKTIQITTTGIHPGSGIGNNRKEISEETLHVPVIAIGVPTIVDAATIVSDTFQYMMKQFSYKIDNLDNQKLKLISEGMQDYSEHPDNLTKEQKSQILGMLGTLSNEEFKKLIYEVLSPIESNLMVTPKEVDFVIEKLGLLIGNGINKSLHEHFNPTN